ncbi:hypothetical protein D3C81_1493130 [compost metagenome]
MQVAAVCGYRNAAPAIVVIVLLARGAEGEYGIVAQIGSDNAIEQATFVLHDVLETLVVLVRRDQPATHAGIVGQRARHVDVRAVTVPASSAGADAGLGRCGRFLAHQVDRCRRVASALHHAGGAAHDLHMVVDGHVTGAGGLTCRARAGNRDAVVHEVVDQRTASVIALAIRAKLLDGQAWGALDHIIKGAHCLVVDALAGDHRR